MSELGTVIQNHKDVFKSLTLDFYCLIYLILICIFSDIKQTKQHRNGCQSTNHTYKTKGVSLWIRPVPLAEEDQQKRQPLLHIPSTDGHEQKCQSCVLQHASCWTTKLLVWWAKIRQRGTCTPWRDTLSSTTLRWKRSTARVGYHRWRRISLYLTTPVVGYCDSPEIVTPPVIIS